MGLLDSVRGAVEAVRGKAQETVQAAREGHAEPYAPAAVGATEPTPGQPQPYADRTPAEDPTAARQPEIPSGGAPGQLDGPRP